MPKKTNYDSVADEKNVKIQNGYAYFGEAFICAVLGVEIFQPQHGEKLRDYERRILKMARGISDESSGVKMSELTKNMAFQQLWLINQHQIYGIIHYASKKLGLNIRDSNDHDFQEIEQEVREHFYDSVSKYDFSHQERFMSYAGHMLQNKALSEAYALRKRKKNGGMIFRGADGSGGSVNANLDEVGNGVLGKRAMRTSIVSFPSFSAEDDDGDLQQARSLEREIEECTASPHGYELGSERQFIEYFKQRVQERCGDIECGNFICDAFFTACEDMESKKGTNHMKKPPVFGAIKNAEIQDLVENVYEAEPVTRQAFFGRLIKFKRVLQETFAQICQEMSLDEYAGEFMRQDFGNPGKNINKQEQMNSLRR